MAYRIPSDYEELYKLYKAQLEENERLRRLLRIHGIDDIAEQRERTENHDAASCRGTEPLTGAQLSMDLPMVVTSSSIESIDTGFHLTKKSTTEEKTALFRKLFTGRNDAYAYRWTNKAGRSGYSPACRNLWVPGICGKPKAKCAECPNADYYPFDDDAVRKHLSGEQVLGVYALLNDDTCRFLAIDFDEETWKDDVSCLRQLCENERIPCSVETSRSGNGAHMWFFLNEPVEAVLARRFATCLLESCMQNNPRMTFKSFDRMFPNQDTMPKGGFGNLIALPLQKEAAQKRGGSLFVNEDFEPYQDQWAYLSGVRLLRRDDLKSYVERAKATDTLPQNQNNDEEKPWDRHTGRLPAEDTTKQLSCILANRLYIETKGVSPRAQNQLKRLASF
ncbi:MAG: helicase, partial [Clostridia bacterium]|nr:helicase [Clostridia bacterium]